MGFLIMDAHSGSLSSIENENNVRTFVRMEIILILLDSAQFCIL